MATDNSVRIVIAADDKSGAVLSAVEERLKRAASAAETFGRRGAEAGQHVVPEMIAASASVRALQGNFEHNTRAVERFLSTTLGLSGVFDAIFPIVGAVTFGVVIAQDAEKLYEMVSGAKNLSSVMTDAFQSLNENGQLVNDNLEITNDRLRDAIAKLEGKPKNGMKDAIDDARKSADELYLKLVADAGEIQKVFANDTLFKRIVNDQRSTGNIQDEITKSQKAQTALQFATSQAEQKAKSDIEAKNTSVKGTNDLIAEQQRLLEKLQAAHKTDLAIQASSKAGGVYKYDKEHSDVDTRVSDEEGAIAFTQNQILNERQRLDTADLTARRDHLEGVKEVNQKAKEAEEERERQYSDHLKAMAAIDKELERNKEELGRISQDTVESEGRRYFDPLIEGGRKALELSQRTTEALKEQFQEQSRAASADGASANRSVSFQERTGQIGAAQATARYRAIAQAQYIEQFNALKAIAEADRLLNPDNPEKYARDKAQILQLTQAYEAKRVELAQQSYLQQQAAAAGYVNDIIDPLISGPQKISDAFKKMAENIEKSLARIAERRLTEGITNAILGPPPGSAGGAGRQGGASTRGIGGVLSELGIGLFGRSKGPNATPGQAGTVPTDTAAKLGTGAGSGGINITVINQTSQDVSAAPGGSSKDNLGNMFLSFILKDAQKLGPGVQAIGGALKMIPGL